MKKALILLIAGSFSALVLAENTQSTAGPATQPAQVENLTATVVSVTGTVQKLMPNSKTWEPVKVGDELGELCIIRTGLRSKAVLKLQDRGEVTIDDATKVGISDFHKQGQRVRSQLGLKYGTVRADVNPKVGPIDFRIGTPVATLTVRGTAGSTTYFSDSGLWLDSEHGTWGVGTAFTDHNVTGSEDSNESMTPGALLTFAQFYAYLNDYFGGTDFAEQQFLIFNSQGRGTFILNDGSQIQDFFLHSSSDHSISNNDSRDNGGGSGGNYGGSIDYNPPSGQ